MEICSICYCELKTDEEKEKGICEECELVLLHDKFEGEQLF